MYNIKGVRLERREPLEISQQK